MLSRFLTRNHAQSRARGRNLSNRTPFVNGAAPGANSPLSVARGARFLARARFAGLEPAVPPPAVTLPPLLLVFLPP